MESLISECLKLDIESSFLNKKSVLNENNPNGSSSQQEVNSNKNDKKIKKSSQKRDKTQKEPKIGQRWKKIEFIFLDKCNSNYTRSLTLGFFTGMKMLKEWLVFND